MSEVRCMCRLGTAGWDMATWQDNPACPIHGTSGMLAMCLRQAKDYADRMVVGVLLFGCSPPPAPLPVTTRTACRP